MKYRSLIYVCVFPIILNSSTSLRDAISNTLLNNPEILSYEKNNKANRYYVDEAKGAYLPSVDLDLSYQKMDTYEKETDNTIINQGPEVKLSVSQTVYDGSLTYNTILERKHGYKETFFKNKAKVEDIVIDTINAYLDLKKAQELIFLSKENITEHERILQIAKENEDISGEVIDRLQAESRAHTAYNTLIDKQKDEINAYSEYYKTVGNKPTGPICRPILNERLFPSSLSLAIDKAMKMNLEIRAQLEYILKQRAILAQEKSRFLPTIVASLSAAEDSDITTDEVTSRIYTSKISLSYNLFRGNQDINSYQKEKMFLHESQKELDRVTKDIEDRIKQSYSEYTSSIDRIENLKKFVELKKKILSIYQEQFQGGTRTVIDLLSEAGDLFTARQEQTEEEYKMLKSYYQMLALFGNLSNSILEDGKQVCKEEKIESLIEIKKADDTIDEDLAQLLNGDMLVDESPSEDLSALLEDSNNEEINLLEDTEVQNVESSDDTVESMLEKLLNEAYTNKETAYLIEDNKSLSVDAKMIGDKTFKDRFLTAPAEYYTINIVAFGSMQKASKFIKENGLRNDSFAFQFGRKLNLFKVVYGIFETYTDAQKKLNTLSFKEKYHPIIEKVGGKQQLYQKYNINYEIPSDDSVADSVEDDLAIEDEEVIDETPIENNEEFKNKFMSLDKDGFTINVYTFLSVDSAQKFVKENSLEDKALLFRFGKKRKLVKLVYGAYNSINEANSDLVKLKAIDENIYPVVEKIYKQRNVLKRFSNKNSVKNGKINITKKNDNSISKINDNDELLNPKFLNNLSGYTINLATLSSLEKAKWYVDRYNLADEATIYKFGADKSYYKVIYGVYETYEDALDSLNGLDDDIQKSKPFIDNINKHQKLYRKYNSKE